MKGHKNGEERLQLKIIHKKIEAVTLPMFGK